MSDYIQKRVWILTKKNGDVCPIPEQIPESGITVCTKRKDLVDDAKGWPKHEDVRVTEAILVFRRRAKRAREMDRRRKDAP